MELALADEGGCMVARVSGVIDQTAEGPFRESLHPLVGQKGAQVVMDLSDAPRITSAGIGQLVILAAHANHCGSRIVLAACTPFVAVVMSHCKLDKFFEIAETVPEAIGRFRGA